MKKFIWQIVAGLLLIGLIFTSVSWSNAQKTGDTAQKAIELVFDSAYTSGDNALVNIEKIMGDAVTAGNWPILRPDMNLTFFTHKLRSAVSQAQFGEALANQKTDFFFAPIGNAASQLGGLLLSVDAELTTGGARLDASSVQVLSQVRDAFSQLRSKWQAAKEPSISREGLSEDQIYLTDTEANQIADQIRTLNGLLEQLLGMLE